MQNKINYLQLFLGKYEVLEDGTIINRKTGRIRKASILKGRHKNYLRVNAIILGKHITFPIHRVVCYKFNPIPFKDVLTHEVEHLDGNPMNNHKDNLCWIDPYLNKLTWREAA